MASILAARDTAVRSWGDYLTDWRLWIGLGGLSVASWLTYDILRVPPITSSAYLDFSVDGQPVGRVVLGLFGKDNPLTVRNFEGLASHSLGFGYRNSPIHKVVKGFVVMGGDIMKGTGGGGSSIYGPFFTAEKRSLRHKRGTISMVVEDGDNAVRSQFFITLMSVPGLDKVMVPFGVVTSGLEVVEAISALEVDKDSRPRHRVLITGCGMISADTLLSDDGAGRPPALAAEAPLLRGAAAGTKPAGA